MVVVYSLPKCEFVLQSSAASPCFQSKTRNATITATAATPANTTITGDTTITLDGSNDDDNAEVVNFYFTTFKELPI